MATLNFSSRPKAAIVRSTRRFPEADVQHRLTSAVLRPVHVVPGSHNTPRNPTFAHAIDGGGITHDARGTGAKRAGQL